MRLPRPPGGFVSSAGRCVTECRGDCDISLSAVSSGRLALRPGCFFFFFFCLPWVSLLYGGCWLSRGRLSTRLTRSVDDSKGEILLKCMLSTMAPPLVESAGTSEPVQVIADDSGCQKFVPLGFSRTEATALALAATLTYDHRPIIFLTEKVRLLHSPTYHRYRNVISTKALIAYQFFFFQFGPQA